MFLVLDMPVGADMPVIGGQELVQGLHITGHEGLCIQFGHISLGQGRTGKDQAQGQRYKEHTEQLHDASSFGARDGRYLL